MGANIIRLGIAIALGTAIVSAQALAEHAAAAAGAALGTGAGKGVSTAVDKIFHATGNAADNAAAGPHTKEKPAAPAETKTPARAASQTEMSGPPPKTAPVAHAEAHVPQKAEAHPVIPQPVFFSPSISTSRVADPPLRPLSAQDFANVKQGEAREQVFAALGPPSSHVSIPDEGHLVEIMSYSRGNQRIGAVRLDNGQVVSVTVSAVR